MMRPPAPASLAALKPSCAKVSSLALSLKTTPDKAAEASTTIGVAASPSTVRSRPLLEVSLTCSPEPAARAEAVAVLTLALQR